MNLSIIIPVYNQTLYLRKCLNSVVNQSCEKLEIIVIDDCSTDDSFSILQEFEKLDKRIKLFKNQFNIGSGATRNIGINLATGKYLWFIDSDDWIENDAISILIDVLESEKGKYPIYVFGHFEHYIDSNNLRIKRERPAFPIYEIEDALGNFIQLTKGLLSYPWQYIYCQKLITKNAITFQENTYYEDILFGAMAIYYASNVRVLPNTIYNYNYIFHGSITQLFSKKHVLDLLFIYSEFHEFLIQKEIDQKYNDRFVIRFLLFGIGTCLEIYDKLKKQNIRDKNIEIKLKSYLSQLANKENISYINEYIFSIDNRDQIIKQYYYIKLNTIKKSII